MLPKDERGVFSDVELNIWLEVFGDAYPSDAVSYTTFGELDDSIEWLDLDTEALLLDMGCGQGGPGKYVASASRCGLVGIDASDSAIQYARKRPPTSRRHSYQVGSFGDIPLDENSADGILCIDSLFFAENKRAAIHDLARVARPSARLVLTDWDYVRQPANRPPQVSDHRPLLEEAGFKILTYSDSPQWFPRHRDILDGLRAHARPLSDELGINVDQVRKQLAELAQTIELIKGRFFCVAERKGLIR